MTETSIRNVVSSMTYFEKVHLWLIYCHSSNSDLFMGRCKTERNKDLQYFPRVWLTYVDDDSMQEIRKEKEQSVVKDIVIIMCVFRTLRITR